MNRGSLTYRVPKCDFGTCFNEAPIHESGKFRSARTAAPNGNRFNEAPIHESGKSQPPPSGNVEAVLLQ